MPRLLTMAMARNPQPAPPRRPDQPVIYSHPHTASPGPAATGQKGDAAVSLHNRLQAAWQASDWRRLAAVAREYLEADGPAGPALHPFTMAATAFLRPAEIAATDHDLRQFIKSFDRGALKEYLARAHGADRSRLADHALALHCLGALGEATINPIAGLRVLTAFAALVDAVAEEGPGSKLAPTRILGRLIEADVVLPAWTFQIDVCGEVQQVFGARKSALTPLELRLQRLERMRSPTNGDCDCKSPETPVCTPQSVCCQDLKYYVADLLELRDWTHRYKAGDLAYIENVGAGEMRSREHEMRRTDEVFTEAEATVRSLNKRDQQVTDSGSLKREIERQTESKLSADASVEGTYNAAAYTVTAAASLSYDKSASEAIKEAQEQSRQAVTSAVSELEKQVRTLRSERVTTQETEKNVHAWDNKGTEPKVTKYFWVTQEKRAQLFSHGKRLMAEMIIPSPARLYEKLLELRRENLVNQIPAPTGEKPIKPADIPFGPEDLTAANYLQHAAPYGVASPPPPPEMTKQVSVTMSHGEVGANTALQPIQVQIPQDYHAITLSLSGNVAFKPAGERYLEFWIGDSSKVEFHPDGGTPNSSLANLTGAVTIDGRAKRINSCSVVLTLSLVLDAASLAAWQQAVFQLIEDSYDARMAAYKTAFDAYEAKQAEFLAKRDKLREELKEKETDRNPFFNREIERTELKRAAIYLMCEDFSAESAWIRMAEPCGLPEIDRHAAAERGYGWYFWDRLFDWKHMAYAFFDYFWNPICDWPDRFDPQNPDPLFKAFLGAGYARLLIPVSPAMEQDFLWYVSTHQKWGQTGEPPLDANDPRWQNVLYELKYASASAMTPRVGHVANVAQGDLSVLIKDTDRYWDSLAMQVDAAAVAADLDRELFIDGAIYLVSGIQPEPGSPPYSGTDTMWWRVALDRPYEGTASPRRLYSLGAQAVAPAFSFDMPTELIWAGAHNACLPSYPLPPCPE